MLSIVEYLLSNAKYLLSIVKVLLCINKPEQQYLPEIKEGERTKQTAI